MDGDRAASVNEHAEDVDVKPTAVAVPAVMIGLGVEAFFFGSSVASAIAGLVLLGLGGWVAWIFVRAIRRDEVADLARQVAQANREETAICEELRGRRAAGLPLVEWLASRGFGDERVRRWLLARSRGRTDQELRAYLISRG